MYWMWTFYFLTNAVSVFHHLWLVQVVNDLNINIYVYFYSYCFTCLCSWSSYFRDILIISSWSMHDIIKINVLMRLNGRANVWMFSICHTTAPCSVQYLSYDGALKWNCGMGLSHMEVPGRGFVRQPELVTGRKGGALSTLVSSLVSSSPLITAWIVIISVSRRAIPNVLHSKDIRQSLGVQRSDKSSHTFITLDFIFSGKKEGDCIITLSGNMSKQKT